MFKNLDNRIQLAIALMATEKVYYTWVHNYRVDGNFARSDKNCSIHLNNGSLSFLVWRKTGKTLFASFEVKSNSEDNRNLVVKSYFRGIDRDTLELDDPNATFEDYLHLANLFPDQAVELSVQGLFNCFERAGLLSEFSYYVGVATNLLNLKD